MTEKKPVNKVLLHAAKSQLVTCVVVKVGFFFGFVFGLFVSFIIANRYQLYYSKIYYNLQDPAYA